MKFVATITIFSLLSILVNAQQMVGFNRTLQKPFVIQNKNENSLSVSLSLPNLVFDSLTTENETFLTLTSQGFSKCYKPGEPDLPVYNQLIVVPLNVTLHLTLAGSSEELIELSSIKSGLLIKPAQASVSKNQNNPDKIPFVKGKAYLTNSFTNSPVVELREVGIMRDVKLYELVYNPVVYNAVSNQIKVRHLSSVKLSWDKPFKGSNTWDFTNTDVRNLNPQSANTNELRETYVIVSPLKYKENLQPFVHWKELQGFFVIEAYIGEAIASADKNVIKTYLKGLYTTPSTGVASPSYLLLVGDVDDIPAWKGITDVLQTYVTDLYYAEYTNDFLPELYVGRFSVNNTQQLQAIIEKTLYVEQGAGNERSYQNDHLLISGVDADYAPIYCNGTLNYFLDNYSLPAFGVNAHYYMYGSGSNIVSNSSGAKKAILDDFDAGVGIAFYTAHCNLYGWANPAFTISEIAFIDNRNKYPLMIGNCCQSYRFNLSSFGEEIVRSPEKGAVAYIGATYDSYWDEDYFWGVGFTSNITAHPSYDSTGLGSWDAWFHTHNEIENQKAYTAGQILNTGNMAVQGSNSDLKDYYWEIYGIMGDPSLVPAKYQLLPILPQFNSELTIGQSTLTVQATKGSMVTLSENGQLVAYGKTDASNTANLLFIKPLSDIGEKMVEICVSHPDFAPFIDTLSVKSTESAYLVINKVIINDSVGGNNNHIIEYGESIDYYFEIKNLGSQDAQNILVIFNSQSQWIKPLNNNMLIFPTLKAGESIPTEIPFEVEYKNNAPNQELVVFTGILNYCDSLTTQFDFSDTINAPEIKETNWLIDMAGIGNGDGIIDINEDVTLTVFFTNIGQAQVSNTVVTITSSNSELLLINPEPLNLGGMNASETKQVDLVAKGGKSFFQGTQVFLQYEVVAGDSGQYLFSGQIPVIMGTSPDILMHSGTEEIVTANFYDSGGPGGKYFNHESSTLTIIPHNAGEGIMVSFNEFDVESSINDKCWDILSVYDGSTTDAPLLGSFCSTTINNFFQSQNGSGALTFIFKSDESTTKSGWKAYISSSPKSLVTFELSDGVSAVTDASVDFVNKAVTTDANGIAVFENVLNWSTKNFTITKTGYFTKTGTINNLLGDTIITILLAKLPEIGFTVFENAQPVTDVMISFNNDTLYTNINGKAAFTNVIPGNKSFKASKAGYVDTTGTITVGTISNSYTLEMRQIPVYTANFMITDAIGVVAEAAVTIGDITKKTSTEGIVLFDGLIEGNYDFTIEKEGYILHSGTFTVVNANVNLTIELFLVGISQQRNKGLSVYPNPVSKGKSLIVASNTLINELVIYNYTGSILVTLNEPATEYVIDFSGFSSGIYILQANVGGKQYFEKVIVD